MVYPSPACHICKKRRVKCDEARPICGQCVRGNRACTWDTPKSDELFIRSENHFAAGKPRRPRRVKSQDVIMNDVSMKRPQVVEIALPASLSDRAVEHWVQNYEFLPEDLPSLGYDGENLATAHYRRRAGARKQEEGSYFDLAVSAYAQAWFGKIHDNDKAMEEADLICTKTLANARQEMTTMDISQTHRINELLIASLLMMQYEGTVYGSSLRSEIEDSAMVDSLTVQARKRFDLWRGVCHSVNASELLRRRLHLDGAPNLPLDAAVRRQIIRGCILEGVSLPPWLEDGETFGEKGPLLSLDQLMVRTAVLRSSFLQLLDGEDTPYLAPMERLRTVAFDAQDMEDPFEAWEAKLPQEWRFHVVQGDKRDLRHEYPDGSRVATTWNRWRAARLVVTSIRFKSYTVLFKKFPDKTCIPDLIASCRRQFDELSMDMCRSLPCFYDDESVLGPGNGFVDVDGVAFPRVGARLTHTMASLLAWPLMVVVSTKGVPSAQREWLSQRLKEVAKVMGDGFLESVAEERKYRF